jgi:hypothetical protein
MVMRLTVCSRFQRQHLSMRTVLALSAVMLLSSCGNPDNEIVGVMVKPTSTQASVGAATGFTAEIQYVDGHTAPLSEVEWSIQGTASLVFSSSGGEVTVQCVRPSDYFAGGYVPDKVQGKAEVNGRTYTGWGSLVCK